jgi:lipopolysaccharide export system ATP-binding protein
MARKPRKTAPAKPVATPVAARPASPPVVAPAVAVAASPVPTPVAAAPAGAGLVVDKVGKRFGDRQVVKNVSLRLARGEVVGLLGPNGAGKTTCFYMITGLIPVDYGSITLDGADITALPMYQRARLGVGYLPQEASIFRGLTVEQNVMAVVEMRVPDQAQAERTTSNLLEELHIAHLRAAPAISLSGGERRRVEIARALASEPAFMLLDEPFAGIDPLAINDIREVIGYLKGRGIGILITDHNVRETLDIIDRASIIHAGEVLFEGSPQEIIDDPEVRRVYLGERFGQAVSL